MAGNTIGLDHILGMRLMTIGTLRDTAMSCRMTIHALQTLMLGLAVNKFLEHSTVAGGALDRGNLITVNDRSRTVRRVAEFTLVVLHLRRMRLMALTTQRNFTVLFFVTGGASKLAVFGRAVDQYL